jgi:hypothetical protein
VATQLEELQHDLEWTEHLLSNTASNLDEISSRLDEENAENETTESRRLIVAYSVSFLDLIDDLRDEAERLQKKGLIELQAKYTGDNYWQRMADRHHGRAVEIQAAVGEADDV